MLIGLGVRLGTSPAVGDTLGNKPDRWFLAGSYLRVRTKFGKLGILVSYRMLLIPRR
jgi:hypothetical protein